MGEQLLESVPGMSRVFSAMAYNLSLAVYQIRESHHMTITTHEKVLRREQGRHF